MKTTFDVAVIGAGVVGCAVARELARYEVETVVFESNRDFGAGASKGNTATLCSGCDTPRGTLERKLVVRGHQRYLDEGSALGLPVKLTGSLTIAWTDEQAAVVEREYRHAIEDGFDDVELLTPNDIYQRVPHVAAGGINGLHVPDEGIVDPFSTSFAYLLDAVSNGATYLPSSPITASRRERGLWVLASRTDEFRARVVINCAGLQADAVEALADYADFKILPRRGQYIVFDKSARRLVEMIVKPAPSQYSRGIYIAPTIFGNVLAGPTAEDVADSGDRRVTAEGLANIRQAIGTMLPNLLDCPVITTYAGMRPATEESDYRIIPRLEDGWLTVAGIRSTGLTAALGIAEYVVDLIVPDVIQAAHKDRLNTVSVPDLSDDGVRPWMDAAKIAGDPAYGEMLCHCERITVGEVRDVLASPLPPRSLKALKRRSRVMFGGCQGFFCGARVEKMFDAAQADHHP